MNKRLFIIFAMLLTMLPSFAGSKVSKYAGVYRYDEGECYGEIRVAIDAAGNVYFEGHAEDGNGNLAVFRPDKYQQAKLQGNKVSFSKMYDNNKYTITLNFNGDVLNVEEESKYHNPDFGRDVCLSGRYYKDDSYVGDDKGIIYSYINEGLELGVVNGGRYCGDLVVPASVNVNGVEVPVTTVRKNAFKHDFDTPEAHMLKSLNLSAVTLVGVYAFDGNKELQTIKYGKAKTVCVEAGAYFNCPKLDVGADGFEFGYSDNPYEDGKNAEAQSRFIVPCAEEMPNATDYHWACFKQWHNRMKTIGYQNIEDGGDYYYSSWSKVKGQKFELLNKSAAANMFWGYQGANIVVLATNGYMGKHTFPLYNRFKWGEEVTNMSDAFKKDMAKRYNRTVKYSYEVAKTKDAVPGTLAITEFELKNKEAMVVLSWVVNGKVEAEWTDTTTAPEDYDGYGLWNVDDEGQYGIPEVISIAYDDKENVEIFINHPAPESINLIRLVQDGKKLVENGGVQWYVYYN